MQKIVFRTVSGTIVTVTDVNTSKRSNGSYLPLHLIGFEGNSAGVTYEQSERVGFSGIGIYGAKTNARTIELELAMLAKDGKERTMYALRSEVLRCFPPGEEGTLTYTNDSGEYQIECYVQEYPAIERDCGVLCSTKIYLTAACPFWRKQANDITLTANATDSTASSISFNAATEMPVPMCAVLKCTADMTGSDTHSALITVSGNDYGVHFGHIARSGDKSSLTRSVSSKKGELYLTEYMAANDSFMIDWGLLGRFYIDSGKYSYVDFIKSTPQYIYPGSNTLSAKLYGTTGSLSITLRRFDYVRGV